MILAIDTSLGTSVALIDGDRIVAEAHADDSRHHAEVVGTLLAEVLGDGDENRAAGRADVTEVVAGMGPGPFTGLRVGIAAARAAAFGLGVVVRGVCSHDAAGASTTGLVQVTTDVRRRERAWSVYRDGVRIDGPHLAPADAVPAVDGARRVDVEWLRASDLAFAAATSRDEQQAIYLREADAVPSAGVKRVSQPRAAELHAADPRGRRERS